MVESGTHEKLVDTGGLYSELWSVQETMFTAEGDELQDEATRSEK